jgi:hypothetical protein
MKQQPFSIYCEKFRLMQVLEFAVDDFSGYAIALKQFQSDQLRRKQVVHQNSDW